MGLIKFKQIKPLPFTMRARYWDPVKEAREQRIKEIKAMQEDSVEGMKARLSRRFRGGYNEYYHAKKIAVRKQNLILMAALIAVLYAAYFILVNYLPRIEAWLDKALSK